MRETTAPLVGWSRSFPPAPEQVGEARRYLAAILDGRPADDAILCLSELVTNATVHSRSRQVGGYVTVRVQLHGDHLRVDVCDQGGPWTEPTREDGQTGRGLLIVDQLACTWGRTGDEKTGWVTWFELECS
ncbi:MAG: ATP-binding protein [Streptosporangiaceae bacterium]